jgi:hypothetical protein
MVFKTSIVALGVALISAACGNDSSGGIPTFPSPSIAPEVPSGRVLTSGATPLVTALSIDAGSTGGGTPIKIRGTNLDHNATVTFGNNMVRSNSWDPRDEPGTSLLVHTPAHAAGAVDVIVTNPNQQTFRLSGGYAFVPQESFDLNGDWDGVTTDGTETMVQFTIKNNVLVAASCWGGPETEARFALSGAVSNAEFSVESPDAFLLSGRSVAAIEAVGHINAAACNLLNSPWAASKLTSNR